MIDSGAVRRERRRLWAVSVNHTVLPHRRHLSPNTKGFSPQGTLKPISSLTCNPSRSTESSAVECYHIHLFCERGMFGRKVKRQRTEKKGEVWGDFEISPIFTWFNVTALFGVDVTAESESIQLNLRAFRDKTPLCKNNVNCYIFSLLSYLWDNEIHLWKVITVTIILFMVGWLPGKNTAFTFQSNLTGMSACT